MQQFYPGDLVSLCGQGPYRVISVNEQHLLIRDEETYTLIPCEADELELMRRK